jgi:hypothetical protein
VSGSGGGGDVVPGNLISDGDFSQGLGMWHVTALTGALASAPTITDGTMCVGVAAYQAIVVGWPTDSTQGVPLSAGTYTLSYSASVSGASTLQIIAKVGSAMGGSTDFTSTDTLNGSLVQTFKDTGMAIADPDGGDANAGVAFVVTDTTNATINLCFASISLTRVNN